MMNIAPTRTLPTGRIFAVALLVLALAPLGAQNLQLADMDLTTATLHQAGPTSFYVRGVIVDGETYSIQIDQDTSGSWTVTGITPESENILPRDTILDFATISVEGSVIKIDGVLVGDSVYGGSLAVGEDADLALAEAIRTATNETVNTARSEALRAIIAAETEAAFREQLEAQRVEYEARLESLREERDRLEGQLAALPGSTVGAADGADTGDAEAGVTADSGASSPLSGAQVDSLLKERDQLAGDIVGLVSENNELRSERTVLRERITELQARNTELLDDISSMTGEVDRLQELVEAYRSATAATPAGDSGGSEDGAPAAEAPAAGWSFPGDYVRTSDLEAAAQAVSMEIRALESRVAALETAAGGLARLEESLRTGIRDGLPVANLAGGDAGTLTGGTSAPESAPGGSGVSEDADTSFGPKDRPGETSPRVTDEPATASGTEGAGAGAPADDIPATRDEAVAAAESSEAAARLADLQAQVADLLTQNERLRDEQRAIEDRILNEILDNGFVRMMEERMTRSLVRGFSRGTSDSGDWNVSSGRALQQDEDAFFAKLAVPAEQTGAPVLYSFRVRSLDDGWVGVGLHLFVTGVERRYGYGMGSSLLVWFTRDPDVRKNETTYLQLYRSDDDVDMERVMDAAIPESLDEFLDVDVLYEPGNQYITIAVNGTDRIRYRTWFGVDSGVELALRSLGRADFQGFTVRSME